MKKVLIVVLILALSYGILAVGNNLTADTAQAADTYTGTADGFGGEVSVTVKVNGNKIVDVAAEGPEETEGIGSKAVEQLPAKIKEANSTNVDAITGATFTSKAIIEAVNKALESAK
jgi:uncharacterized protein with FMN-binding domain